MSVSKRPKKKLKKSMPTLTESEAAEVNNGSAYRDVSMFKGWLMGKSYEQLAAENGISLQSVFVVSKKYNWRSLKKELRNRQFNAAIDRVRDLTVFIQDALEADIRSFVARAVENRQDLTKEERDHLYKMYDRTLKEIRLDDGKPTEIGNGGTLRVEIGLPAGAKRFGVIPPSKQVTLVETDKQEKNEIDLESIEDDMTGKIK